MCVILKLFQLKLNGLRNIWRQVTALDLGRVSTGEEKPIRAGVILGTILLKVARLYHYHFLLVAAALLAMSFPLAGREASRFYHASHGRWRRSTRRGQLVEAARSRVWCSIYYGSEWQGPRHFEEFGYGGTNEILNDPVHGLNNKNVVGMEIIAKDDKDVLPNEVQSAVEFMKKYYPNTPVYGHGQVNPGHKEATEGQSARLAVEADRERMRRAAGMPHRPVTHLGEMPHRPVSPTPDNNHLVN
jgi:hypothetical protein